MFRFLPPLFCYLQFEKSQNLSDPTGSSSSCASPTQRVPKGQTLVNHWAVLDLRLSLPKHYSDVLQDPKLWYLKVGGILNSNSPRKITWDDLAKFTQTKYKVDWHCVTGWSSLDIEFIGIPFKEIIGKISPKTNWTQLYQVGADGYITNVFREDVDQSNCFLAITDGNGSPISKEHGGIRLVFPTLFGWKSAKYLTEINFEDNSREIGFYGFWETNGCHVRGRVAFNERWSKSSEKEWNFKIAMLNMYKVFGNGVWMKVMQLGGRGLGRWVEFKKLFTTNKK